MKVFISHSGADRAWAARLAQALAGFRPPGGARLTPVLPAAGDAAATGREIGAADWLVVICSPRAAASDLIAEEIRAFARPDRILRLVVDGEPGAARHRDLAHQECLPPPLRVLAPAESADIRSDRDGWPAAARRLAARAAGVTLAELDGAERRARRRTRLWLAAGCVLLAVALAGWRWSHDDNRRTARVEVLRAGALAALTLLDRDQPRQALAAFAAANAAPPVDRDWPPEVRIAAARLLDEARLIADHPAPSRNIDRLAWLPDGALAASAPDGTTYLADPATGDAALVFAPPGRAFTRVAPDGRRLFAARFEPVRPDALGEPYAPLVFEDVDLQSGETLPRAAVPATPAARPSAAISPDGALFAADLGPGAAGDTVIAAFRRDAQALAGLLSLPSDRARLRFLGPDLLLARTDPPGGPGLYLWRVGEVEPRTLRAPRDRNGCGGSAAGAKLAAAPGGGEVGLLSVDGCLDRWTPTGAPRASVKTARGGSLTVIAAGGPYAVTAGALTTLVDAGGAVLARFDSCAAPLAATPDSEAILCAEAGVGAVHFGAGPLIRARWHEREVRAFALDPARARLATIGDGRLRIWDATPPLALIARLEGPARLSARDGGVVVTLGGQARVFSATGVAQGETDPPAAPPPAAETRCPMLTAGAAVLARSPSGARAALRRDGEVAVADLTACLTLRRVAVPTGEVAAALPEENALWLALGGALYMTRLDAPMSAALKILRARARAVAPR